MSDGGSADAVGDAVGDDGSAGAGGASQCPRKAATCPSGCYGITGSEIDETNHCILPGKTVACWSGTGGIDAQFGCIEDPSDGTKYRVPSTGYIKDLTKTGEWLGCVWQGGTQPCP